MKYLVILVLYFLSNSLCIDPSSVELEISFSNPNSQWCFLWGNFATKTDVNGTSFVTEYSWNHLSEVVSIAGGDVELTVMYSNYFGGGPNFSKYVPSTDFTSRHQCSSDPYDCTCYPSSAYTHAASLVKDSLKKGCRSNVKIECGLCPRWHLETDVHCN